MSEQIKPDLYLNMKREWFAKIWNGEKTVEYREFKPHWIRRIGDWANAAPLTKFVEMRLGYYRNAPAMLIQVYRVDIGKCPYPGWDGQYYRLHFEVVMYYVRNGIEYWPMLNPPRMKERRDANVSRRIQA